MCISHPIGLAVHIRSVSFGFAMGERSDEVLFQAYIDGDQDAFSELFRRWAPRLTALMRRSVWVPGDVQELVQQTFLQLHRSRRDFRKGSALRPWIVTIALNLRRAYHRKGTAKRERPLEDDPRSQPAESHTRLEIQDTQRAVREALASLKPGQREVIELHWFEGLSFEEIAQVVGASRSAVKVRAHRGYQALKEVMHAM